MRLSVIPSKDGQLLAWAQNLSTVVSASPQSFGQTAPAAASFASYVSTYSTAYTAAITPATRTKITIANKDTARTALKAAARLFVKSLEGYPELTNGQREELGLNVPKPPTPVPVPTTPPLLQVAGVRQNIVDINLRAAQGMRRGIAKGAVSAMIYSYVGANPPNDINEWKFEGAATRGKVMVAFPNTLPAFSRVWLSAQWMNRRGEVSQACPPVETNLGTFVVQSESPQLKVAA